MVFVKIRILKLEEITDSLILQIKAMMDEGYDHHPFPREFTVNGFRAGVVEMIRRRAGILFVLETDSGEFAGALAAGICPDLVSERRFASEIIWRVNSKGKGYGNRLYDAFEQWAKRSKAQSIVMAVMEDGNKEKISTFYKSRGFLPHSLQFVKGV